MKKIKLGDACEILNGFAFKSENYVGSGIRVIRISNVQKGYIEDNTPAFYPLETKGLEKYMLEEGDLLISLTGNVGRVAILEKEFMPAALNQRVACLRLKTDKLSKRYLFHILNSDFFEKQCIQYSKGVAQKNMSTAWLKDYEILLYSKEQQELIADILDKMHLIKKSRYYQLQKLDELVKARFVEMFGDEKKQIIMRDVCSIITDGTHQPPDFKNIGIPFIFVSNIAGDKLTYNVEKYIDQDTYDELIKRTPIEVGDVLLSTVGSYGHAAVVKENKKFLFQRHIAYLKPKSELINSDYLHGAILSPNVQEQIERAIKGIAQKTLNLSEVKKLVIPLPSMEKQNQFASFVKEIDKSRSRIQKSLEASQELFDSLMQEYFG